MAPGIGRGEGMKWNVLCGFASALERTEGAEKLGLAESCLGFTDNLVERKIPVVHLPLL